MAQIPPKSVISYKMPLVSHPKVEQKPFEAFLLTFASAFSQPWSGQCSLHHRRPNSWSKIIIRVVGRMVVSVTIPRYGPASNPVITVLKKWANSDLFIVYFRSFSNKHHNNFYNKYMWKNIHPVYGAEIRTHDLRNMSLLP